MAYTEVPATTPEYAPVDSDAGLLNGEADFDAADMTERRMDEPDPEHTTLHTEVTTTYASV